MKIAFKHLFEHKKQKRIRPWHVAGYNPLLKIPLKQLFS